MKKIIRLHAICDTTSIQIDEEDKDNYDNKEPIDHNEGNDSALQDDNNDYNETNIDSIDNANGIDPNKNPIEINITNRANEFSPPSIYTNDDNTKGTEGTDY